MTSSQRQETRSPRLSSLSLGRYICLSIACFIMFSSLHLVELVLTARLGKSLTLPMQVYTNRLKFLPIFIRPLSDSDLMVIYVLPTLVLFALGLVVRRVSRSLPSTSGFVRALVVYFCLFACWAPFTAVLTGVISERNWGYLLLSYHLSFPVRMLIAGLLVAFIITLAFLTDARFVARLASNSDELVHGDTARFQVFQVWLPYLTGAAVCELFLFPSQQLYWLKPVLFLPVLIGISLRLASSSTYARIDTRMRYTFHWRQAAILSVVLAIMALCRFFPLPV